MLVVFYGYQKYLFCSSIDFNEKDFHDRVTSFEVEWSYKTDIYADKPSENAIEIAQSLYKKYSPLIKANIAFNSN